MSWLYSQYLNFHWKLLVLVSRIQKSGTGDNNFGKWKGAFLSDRPVTVDHLQSWSRMFRSDQTEMVRSIWWTNRNFRNFGLNGSRPRSLPHIRHLYLLFCFLYIFDCNRYFGSCLMIDSQDVMKLWVAINVQDHFSNPAPSVFLFFMYI